MKCTFTLVFLFLLFSSYFSYSQDSIRKKIQFHASFESRAQQQLYSLNSLVSMPYTIMQTRRSQSGLPVSFDTITDNPLVHGAFYGVLKTRTVVSDKLQVNADLYGEYRGFSYGTFNKNNTVLFPVIEIKAKDTVHIGKHHLVINGKMGQFLNEKLDEGLMIYNIDLQGTQVKFRYNNTQLAYTIYGDLVNAIGLMIDDLHSLSLEQKLKNDSAIVGASWMLATSPYTSAPPTSYWSIFGHVKYENGWGLFAEISYKPQYYDYYIYKGLDRQTALVAGVQKEIKQKKWYAVNKTEFRYYGHTYNFTNYDGKFRYRDSVKNEEAMYANTTGQYLYPLRKFETPFSQWAVFTEYGDRSIWAVTSVGEFNYEVIKKLQVGINYDINIISAQVDKRFGVAAGDERTSFYTYPFLKVWVKCCPMKEYYLSFYISNRTMNLDVSYPTHYLLKKPFAGIELFCSF